MVTTKQIDLEINEIKKICDELTKELPVKAALRQQKKYKKKITLLRMVKKYLQTNPRIEFIENEQKRLKNLISKINDQFYEWSAPAGCKNPRSKYNAITDYKTLKEQLDVINYLINS